MKRKKVSYEERLSKMSQSNLEIEVSYWEILIDRYEYTKDIIKLGEAKRNLKLVKSFLKEK